MDGTRASVTITPTIGTGAGTTPPGGTLLGDGVAGMVTTTGIGIVLVAETTGVILPAQPMTVPEATPLAVTALDWPPTATHAHALTMVQ